jgi:acetoin utilization protein AcuB
MEFNQASNYLKVLLETTKLKAIMKTPVVTIREDEDFSQAQIKFLNNHTSHLLVVDHDHKLVGVVSQKYIYKTQSPRKIVSEEMDYDPDILVDGDSFYTKETLNNYILRSIMSKNPLSLMADDPVSKAVVLMAKRNISCIPIVDSQKHIEGVITDKEVIRFIASSLEA